MLVILRKHFCVCVAKLSNKIVPTSDSTHWGSLQIHRNLRSKQNKEIFKQNKEIFPGKLRSKQNKAIICNALEMNNIKFDC